MAEKNIKERVQRSYEKYNSYDLQVWSLEFFDEETGGYVVVDLRRIAHSEKSNSERIKYEKEFGMARRLSMTLITRRPNNCRGEAVIRLHQNNGGDIPINYFL